MHNRLQQIILLLLATLLLGLAAVATLQQANVLPSATPDDNDALDIKLKAIFSRSNNNRRIP
jgi:hypothetical protein